MEEEDSYKDKKPKRFLKFLLIGFVIIMVFVVGLILGSDKNGDKKEIPITSEAVKETKFDSADMFLKQIESIDEQVKDEKGLNLVIYTKKISDDEVEIAIRYTNFIGSKDEEDLNKLALAWINGWKTIDSSYFLKNEQHDNLKIVIKDQDGKEISTIDKSQIEKPKESIESPISEPWHKVTSFSGMDDKNTDTFTIKGDKFKLIYKVIPENEYSLFSLFIYEENNKYPLDIVQLNSGKDNTIIYDGPGEYYLKIIAANLMSWEVEIDDYY